MLRVSIFVVAFAVSSSGVSWAQARTQQVTRTPKTGRFHNFAERFHRASVNTGIWIKDRSPYGRFNHWKHRKEFIAALVLLPRGITKDMVDSYHVSIRKMRSLARKVIFPGAEHVGDLAKVRVRLKDGQKFTLVQNFPKGTFEWNRIPRIWAPFVKRMQGQSTISEVSQEEMNVIEQWRNDSVSLGRSAGAVLQQAPNAAAGGGGAGAEAPAGAGGGPAPTP